MKPTTSVEEIHEKEAPPEKWAGPTKLKRVRDYSRGSLRDWILKAETEEDLEDLSKVIEETYRTGSLSERTRKKLAKAFRFKKHQLATQLIKAPPRQKLFVPGHIARGSLLVKPGEESQ